MAAVIKIEINSRSSGSGFDDTVKDINKLDDAAKKTSGSGGGISMMGAAVAGALGGAAVAAAGAALGAIQNTVTSSVSLAGQFEGGMNQFAAAAGGSLEAAGMNVEQFQDLFLGLGAKLPVSTMEVQQAAIALVKGGIDPAVIAAGGLESTLNFAAAAGMGLEEAADLSTKMLGTFTSVTDSAATKTAFMAESQNLMTKAANASTLDVASLGDAMLQAGGQAKAIGLDYEDFVTTMGLISPSFGSAAEAGTSFKNFLTRLQPTTKAAKTEMAQLGLYSEETGSAFFDAQGKFVGVEMASELLKQSLTGLSDSQRVMALQTIFGNDAMGAAAALASGGSEAYQAFAEQMANANGVSAQAAAVNQGFDFAMTNLSGTIESIQIKIGLALLPALTMLVSMTNNVINAFMGSEEAFSALPGPIQAIVAGIFALGAMFQSLIAFIQPAIAAFQEFGSGALQEIITFVTTGKAQFDSFNAIWEVVKTLAQQAVQALVSFVQTNLPIWIATLTQWGTALWQWITVVLPLVIEQLGVWSMQIITWLANNLPTLMVQMLQWGTAMYKWLTDAIPPLIIAASEFIGKLYEWLLGVGLPQLSAWANKAAIALIEWIKNDLVPQVGPALGEYLSTMINFLGSMLGAIGTAAKNIGKGIMDGIAAGIGERIEAVKQAMRGAVDAVISIAKRVLDMRSPSRVMAEQIGMPMAQGIAMGLNQGRSTIAMAGANAAQAGLMGANTSVTYNYNYAPVYSNMPSNPSMDFQMMRSLSRA